MDMETDAAGTGLPTVATTTVASETSKTTEDAISEPSITSPKCPRKEEDERDDEDEGSENLSVMSGDDGVESGGSGGLGARGITLIMLMRAGVVKPGKKVLSIGYKGKQFQADLHADGKIGGEGELFATPSAWAIHCKKLVDPGKKSGCGWAAIKYCGRRLDSFKSLYYQKQKSMSAPPISPGSSKPATPQTPTTTTVQVNASAQAASTTSVADGSMGSSQPRVPAVEMVVTAVEPVVTAARTAVSTAEAAVTAVGTAVTAAGTAVTTRATRMTSSVAASVQTAVQAGTATMMLQQNTRANTSPRVIRMSRSHQNLPSLDVLTSKDHVGSWRKPLCHSYIANRRMQKPDGSLLVECTGFHDLGKLQPFTLTISSNCNLIMDFHAHMCQEEVRGYLGGRWDAGSGHLSVIAAFPARCHHTNRAKAAIVENEIRMMMASQGVGLVGWYHSHTDCDAHPSLRDIDTQLDYQVKLKGDGNDYTPTIGIICSPFGKKSSGMESSISGYWVMPPPEDRQYQYGMPMSLAYTSTQDTTITAHVLNEMRWCCAYYSTIGNGTNLQAIWKGSTTYLEKIKASLKSKLPKEQGDGALTEIIHCLLTEN